MGLKHITEWQSKSVSDLLNLQTDKMVEMAKYLEQGLLALLDGDFSMVQFPASEANRLEKECDRIKEALAEKLFSEKSTLQFTKADRHKIVVKVDSVVNQADLLAHEIQLYELKIPPVIIPKLKDLVKYTIESVKELRDTVTDLRTDFSKAIKDATLVEDERREARNLCWDLLKILYHTPTDPLTLILTREMILDITWLADQAESFSDFIETLAVKYSRIK